MKARRQKFSKTKTGPTRERPLDVLNQEMAKAEAWARQHLVPGVRIQIQMPTVEDVARVLWDSDHSGGARYGITLTTHSSNERDPDNAEAWAGYLENARAVLKYLARRSE